MSTKSTQNPIHLIWKSIILIILILSAYKMAQIAFPYLVPPYPTNIDFLESKESLFKQRITERPFWLIAFYIHISSSVFVLAAGVTQFSKTLMFKYPKVHRLIGKWYIILILFVAAPSGLVMAFFGNGGVFAQIAFVCQAVFWWILSYLAYIYILKGNLEKHGAYMMRSYAMTFSAITLRAMSAVLFWAQKEGYHDVGYPESYILLAWVSWIFNLLLAELVLYLGILRYYFKTHRTS
ncbi:MAG: DUF2306 domain-containing protein [Saprospiraceae bacterium]|nr:DUF2306 domain-containing protein [Saprospiraceae bacterium]